VTTYERTGEIIAKAITAGRGRSAEDIADSALRAMLKARIMPQPMRASGEMFVRFHAHCRFLGEVSKYGYRYWYAKAVAHAEAQEQWPVKIIPRTVTLDTGQTVTIDVAVPESTTRATNAQLLCAYQMITEGAAALGVALPEHDILDRRVG
jgi:hypothetical protein